MSNKLKIVLAIITSILVVSGSAIVFNSQRRNSQTQIPKIESSISSSSSTVSSNSSSQVSGVSVSSNLLSSSLASKITKIDIPITSQIVNSQTPIVEKPKSAPIPQSQTVTNESTQTVIQDVPNVVKLSTDTSIYHQYIRDYLACPTKFYQTLNGGYKFEGETDYKYLCIPQSEADKCPSKTLIYGLKPLVGTNNQIVDGSNVPPGKTIKIEANKYYCAHFFETFGSTSLPQSRHYYQYYFPIGLDSRLPKYFAIPKSIIPFGETYNNINVSFAAIPLSSFSKADQEYIAKNFTVIDQPERMDPPAWPWNK